MKAWTQRYLAWAKTVAFEHAAQEATLLDYLHEVEHVTDRITPDITGRWTNQRRRGSRSSFRPIG
jgi:hypothetical protein